MRDTLEPRSRRIAGLLGTLIALGVIGRLTLLPHPGTPVQPGFFCIACGDTGSVDLVLNVLLFAPLGAGLGLLTRRLGRTTIIALVLSAAIETAQGLLIPGRDSSLSDVIANSFGAFLGAALVVRAAAIFLPTPRTAQRLTLSYALITTVLLLFAGWALTASMPYQKFWVQWLPVKQGFDRLQGRLVSLALNEVSLRPAQVIDPSVMPLERPTGQLALVAEASVFAFPHGIAPVARVANPLAEAVSVSIRQRAVLARVATRAASMHFRAPFVAVPCFSADETDATIGTPFEVIARAELMTARRVRAECISGPSRVHDVTFRPALFWTLAWPQNLALTEIEPFVTAAWVALLFAPLGYWRTRWVGTPRIDAPTDGGARHKYERPAVFHDFARGARLLAPPASIIVPIAALTQPTVSSGASSLAMTDALGALVGGLTGAVLARLTLARQEKA